MHCLPSSIRVLAALSLGLLVTFASSGCGLGQGKVAGTVTFRGKRVAVGTVVLVGSDGLPAYGNIREDGTYVIARVPTGAARVAVNSPDPAAVARARDKLSRPAISLPPPLTDKKLVLPHPEPPAPADRKNWFPIPGQYANPKTSGLTCDVKEGSNTLNLELQ
jgi:hypothetical protein